jgi:hypothetical protein
MLPWAIFLFEEKCTFDLFLILSTIVYSSEPQLAEHEKSTFLKTHHSSLKKQGRFFSLLIIFHIKSVEWKDSPNVTKNLERINESIHFFKTERQVMHF